MEKNETLGFIIYGGEGANWMRSLFSKRKHVFQNIGDGTYNHSVQYPCCSCCKNNTNIKILFNATFGILDQGNDSVTNTCACCQRTLAIGIKHHIGVATRKTYPEFIPKEIEKVDRSKLNYAQEKLSKKMV